MKKYVIIPLVFSSSVLLMGLLPIEKDFESRANVLTLYTESIGADTNSTEYYFYWAEGNKLKKFRFLITELTDSVRVRLLNDMYFNHEGKLALFTYWSGKSRDIERLEQGLGPHFLSKGKCVFKDGKMIQWYENEIPRTKVPIAEWREQEKYILHSAAGALGAWKEILPKKKVIGPSPKTAVTKSI